MIDRDILPSAASFRTHDDILLYQTADAPEFIDITSDVGEVVLRSGVTAGMAVVFSRHTTAAIKINESEPELLKDMARFLGDIAPLDREYFHNDFDVRTVNMEADECPNAHSHCQHLMLSASETVPIAGGTLRLGQWQRIFLVELDRPKRRQVVVQVLGI